MVGQNTDGAPAEHAQEAKDHFALLVVAVGETFVITVAVHGMTRVNGTGRTIAAEAGLSNLHNAGGTITTWPTRQAQRPEAQRLRRKSRASGQAGTRSTNQAPRNNVIRTMTRYHGGARHVTPCVQPCPPPSASTNPLRQVLLRWLSESDMPPRTVLCTPSKSMEAWVVAALFPHDAAVNRGIECWPNPENMLAQQPHD